MTRNTRFLYNIISHTICQALLKKYFNCDNYIGGRKKMSIKAKRTIILAVIIVVAFVLGRLAVRTIMNMLLGGTLFGGNFL